MRIQSPTSRSLSTPTAKSPPTAKAKPESPQAPPDKVTLTGKLVKIAKGAVIGAGIGALATGIGVAGAMIGGSAALLGVAGATVLGVGLAHKMDMMVPSTYSNPSAAPGERTFYGATAGFIGGAYGAAMAGLGLLTGGVGVAAGFAVVYGSTLAATRNAIMGVGDQFPNAL